MPTPLVASGYRRVAAGRRMLPRAPSTVARAMRLLDRIDSRIRLFELDEVAALLDRAAVLARHDRRCNARVHASRASLHRIEARFDAALLSAQQALVLWKALDDRAGEALTRAEITRALLAAGNSREALDEGLVALTAADASGDPTARVQAMRALAHVYLSLEQFDQTIAFCEAATGSAQSLRDDVLEGALVDTLACAYGTMSYQATAQGDHARARTLLERSMAYCREAMRHARLAGHRHNEATALANLSEGLVLTGRAAEAMTLMEAWTDDAMKDMPSVASHHLDIRGRICMTLGRFDEAVTLFTASYDAARTTSLAMQAAEHLAEACERTGDLRAALAHHRRFHALFRQVTSETAQRSASVASVRLETQHARDSAVRHRTMAEDLQRSNDQLARRADDLLQLSLHDPLTGLGNRRSMERLLEQDAGSRAIVMIDVDRFKTINDGWSHLVGDAVLHQVALLIRSCCRETDTAVRYGGDEFAILLGHGDASATAVAAERVRARVEDYDWSRIATGLAVSVSVGFAIAADGTTRSGLLAVADERLYDAKRAGRNRVVGGSSPNDAAAP